LKWLKTFLCIQNS